MLSLQRSVPRSIHARFGNGNDGCPLALRGEDVRPWLTVAHSQPAHGQSHDGATVSHSAEPMSQPPARNLSLMKLRAEGSDSMARSACSRGFALVLAVALGAAAHAPAPASAAEAIVTDAGGRQVRIPDASRILAIGGDVTEILYALGAGGRVVGCRCHQPVPGGGPQGEEERRLHARTVDAKACISVDATVIFASERSGPPEVVKTPEDDQHSLCRDPRPALCPRHRRQGSADRAGDRRRGRGREDRGTGRPRLRRAGSQHRQDQATAARPVRAGRPERPRQRRRAEHQRRCHPQAGRRRERGDARSTASVRCPTRRSSSWRRR